MSKVKNQEQDSASVLEMDARTLLRTINSGALSQNKIFSEKIKRMGKESGSNYELVSLNPNSLVFENLDTQTYFKADIQRLKGGRIRIDNIKELRVVEGQKKSSFTKACDEFVDALGEENQKDADSAFSKISKQHFRSGVVPSNGWVTTRDGVSRYIHVHEDVVPPEAKPFIIKAICEALADKVVVRDGQIVEAVFSDGTEKIRIPITELTRRKVIARHMKEAANAAYKSEGFQNRVKSMAGHFSNGQIKKAAELAVPFMKDKQEFSLLTLDECRDLTVNALASIGSFNDSLAHDLGTLLYKTSCKVNRDDILESWQKTAQKSESAALVQNTRILRERKDFEEAYSDFLDMIFNEDTATRSVRSQAYLNSLKDIRKVLEGSEEEGVLQAIDDYIMKLEVDPEQIDDATLYEVEDLLASISQELIQDVKSLSDYDEIPEPPEAEAAETFGEKDLSGERGGGPAVPLPLGEPGAELGLEPGAPEAGAAAGAPAGGAELDLGGLGEAPPLAADVNKDGASSIAEATVNGKKIGEKISDMDIDKLNAELAEWQDKGRTFFVEDGYDSCVQHLQNYVDQAIKLENDGLVAGFEKILSDNLLEDQGEQPDPYEFVDNIDEAINAEYGYVAEGHKACSECGHKMSAAECMEGGDKCSKCGSAMGEATASEATGDYGGTGTEMGGQDGKGVAEKSSKKSDGRSAGNEAKAAKGGTVGETDSGSDDADDDIDEAVAEATGEYGGTGLKMGGQDGKGLAKKGTQSVSGQDSSGAPGGSASGDKMDDQGGKGVAGKGPKKSDGKSGESSAGSGGETAAASAGGSTPKAYGGTGLDMGGQDGKGLSDKTASSSDGTSHSGSGPGGKATLGEDALPEGYAYSCDLCGTVIEEESDRNRVGDADLCPACYEKQEVSEEKAPGCDCPQDGSCKGNKDCPCPDSCPCKGGKMDEDQYKHGTKRRPMGYKRSSVASEGVDKDIDDAVDAIASTIVNDDDISEGGLPAHLQKYKFGKKDGKKKDDDKGDDKGGDEDKGDDDGDDDDDGDGLPDFMKKEDKDITSPEKSAYDATAEQARKDGDGKKRRPLPKFSDKDYDGSSGAKTADDAGTTGYAS